MLTKNTRYFVFVNNLYSLGVYPVFFLNLVEK